MFGINDSLAGLAGALGGLTYLLFFLLLLAANIALWKYIIKGGHHCCSDGGHDRNRDRR